LTEDHEEQDFSNHIKQNSSSNNVYFFPYIVKMKIFYYFFLYEIISLWPGNDRIKSENPNPKKPVGLVPFSRRGQLT